VFREKEVNKAPSVYKAQLVHREPLVHRVKKELKELKVI
jgi:hypothetical protein